jgi:hypothetical protein
MEIKRLLSIAILILFFPLISLAIFQGSYQIDGKTVTYFGLVPCGKESILPGESPEVTYPCQLCHLFVMFAGVFKYFVFYVVIPIAVLLLVWGGVMFLLRAEDPRRVEEGKKIITATLMGLAIIFSAWLLINVFFLLIGVADWTGLGKGWFEIKCQIHRPS